MTESSPQQPANPAMVGLVVAGVALVVVGAILGFAAGHQASYDGDVAAYASAFGLSDDSKVAADNGWMWAGIVGALIGVVCLIGAAIAAAVRPRMIAP